MANPTNITENGQVAEAVTNSNFEKVRLDGEIAGGILTIDAVVGGEDYPCGRIKEVGLFKALDISADWSPTAFKLRMEGAREANLDLNVTFS